jgi:hypothetical protein
VTLAVDAVAEEDGVTEHDAVGEEDALGLDCGTAAGEVGGHDHARLPILLEVGVR